MLYFSTSVCPPGWYVGGGGAPIIGMRATVGRTTGWGGYSGGMLPRLIPCKWLLISAKRRFLHLAHRDFRKKAAAAKINRNVTISTTLMLLPKTLIGNIQESIVLTLHFLGVIFYAVCDCSTAGRPAHCQMKSREVLVS